MRRGESVTFNYTGGVQTFVADKKGIYKFEVWGAKGGDSDYAGSYGTGGKGGYSVGYKLLEKNTTLYIVCGGLGVDGHYRGEATAGGYNGGGNGGRHGKYGDYDRSAGGSGGGATHIALMTGTLSSIGVGNKNKILIIAGGGGGATSDIVNAGGVGGGLTGGATRGDHSYTATQTSGYAFGQGQNGPSGDPYGNGGGGGGLYGGYSADDSSGGGGTGYIDNVDNFDTFTKATTQGVNNTSGKATITLMKAPSIKYGNKDMMIYYGNKEIELHYGSKDM